MSRLEIPQSQSAGVLICAFLLAVTPNHAQEMNRAQQLNQARLIDSAQQVSTSIQPPQSIISLAHAAKPQAEVLARRDGDATFDHVPANYHVFGASTVGEDAGVETLTLNFAAGTTLTRIESKNKDFVVESGGTCHEGNTYSRGDSCSLQVRFNPQGPGHRLGFVSISHTAEATPMMLGLTGNGYAPVVSFTPSLITTVSGTATSGTGTIKSATNMTVDGGDIVYIADIGNDKIKEIDSSGAIKTVNVAFSTPAALAVDSAGIIYSTNVSGSTYYFSDFTPWGVQTAFGYTYVSTNCTVSAPCAFSTVGMSSPANITIDNNDNLFMLEGTTGTAEMPVLNLGQGTGTLNLWHLKNQYAYASGGPGSFAVDAYGDLFTNYTYTPNSTCAIYYEPLYNAEYNPTAQRVAGGVNCGFSGDGGQARSAEISTKIGQMAFDIAGNMYFVDAGNQRVRRIDNVTGIISTIAGNGTAGYTGDGGAATAATLSNPTGLAVDSQGQVYILSNAPTAGPTQALRKLGVTGFWYFGGLSKGLKSAAKVITVSNTGNNTLTISGSPSFSGANPADFSIDPATTTCGLAAGATLAAGSSCNVGIIFNPTGGLYRYATLTLLDNTVTGSNAINLEGYGYLPHPTMTITSPAAGSSVTSGTTVTFAVSVTYASSPKPTGTVTFKVNGAALGSPVTLSASGTASTTFKETTVSAYTLEADYSGDVNYAAATASETLNVTSAAFPASVSLTPAGTSYSTCGAENFLVNVSSASGGVPTGTVELMSGSTSLASTTLRNGVATISAQGGVAASGTFVASYSGDSLHQPATSSPVSVHHPLFVGSCRTGHLPVLETERDPAGK